MRTLALCLVVAVVTSCQQKPDADYVGADNALITAQLRELFTGDFRDACFNTPAPEINPRTDEEVCGPVPGECEELWSRRPMGAPDEWLDPEGYAAFEAVSQRWGDERVKMLDQCPLNWEMISCWPSEKDQALSRVLVQRDNLRGQISLSPEKIDDLPDELRGLLIENWACNWRTNDVRFGSPINPPGG